MGEGSRSPRQIDTIAFGMRKWPAIHRIGRWFRRTLWGSLVEGFWEFARHFYANNPDFGPPLKTVSVYRVLRCGYPKLNGRIVLNDQGWPTVTADTLMATSLPQHMEQPWPIFWSEHANARLVSESLALLLPDKTLCLESAYNEGRWRSDPASRYLRLPPPVKLAGNWTSIVSKWVPNVGHSNYGHWLVDALPRLALLKEFPPDTRIIIPPDLKPYQKESLEMLGVWDRCRPSPEPHLEIERYFFSSMVGMIACYNPYMINFLRTQLIPKADPKFRGPKKFFMQRTTRRRPVENMDEVTDFFRRKGWEVVKDLDFTLAETIKLFSEAEAFCSNQGSNVTNVLFCKPGCTVMHLIPDSNVDGWIDWIAEVCRLNYHYSVVPVGGPDTTRIVIPIKHIEEFFASAGVSF